MTMGRRAGPPVVVLQLEEHLWEGEKKIHFFPSPLRPEQKAW